MTSQRFVQWIALVAFLWSSCNSDSPNPDDSSLIVGKVEMMGCNIVPRKNLDIQSFPQDVAYIQNLERKYYSLTEKGDSVVNVIISSQKDYEKYIGINAGKDRPPIDFTKNTLVGSGLTVFKCAFTEDVTLVSGCEGYVFKTTLWTGVCDRAITRLTHFVLAEKQALPIRFAIAYNYNNDLVSSQLGEILIDDSCLTGQAANLDMQTLPGYVRNLTWQDVSVKYGLATEGGDWVMSLIIDNAVDYEKYIGFRSGTDRPSIDFSKQKIVGYILDARKCVSLRSTVFESGCNSIIMKATYWRGDCDSGCLCGQFIIISNTSLPMKVRIKYVY